MKSWGYSADYPRRSIRSIDYRKQHMAIKDIKTKEELGRELGSGGDRFALFYSDWCPFCMRFLPEFEKLAAGDPGAFCKISTDALPEAEAQYSIEVVPTVLFFRGGNPDKRLDGILGRGLTPESLSEFVLFCRGGS